MTHHFATPLGGQGSNHLQSELKKMFRRRRKKRERKDFRSDLAMVGLLFARPTDPFAKTNIVPELDYLNSRSGEHLDLFCVGYTKKPHDRTLQQTQPTAWVKGVKWWFDQDAFVKVCKEIQEDSKWEYSGGTELLVANARSYFEEATIDYSSVIPCKLEQMQSDKAINNVREFFEKLFKEAENPTPGDPISRLSDRLGLKLALSSIKKLILDLILKGLDEEYTKARHFVLSDLSKKE
jgi:hypothetical protein